MRSAGQHSRERTVHDATEDADEPSRVPGDDVEVTGRAGPRDRDELLPPLEGLLRAKIHSAVMGGPPPRGRFGRYELIGVLGKGSMGTVMEAHDRQLDRKVALKLLHRGRTQRQAHRLVREAKALAKLSHPNVVQVYEAGEHEGQRFIAMELVRGETLRAWQQRRPGWRECVEVYVQAGQGLAAAHAIGLVHRDFKPGNCIVDDAGRARVLDFGLVRDAEEVPSEGGELPEGLVTHGSLTSTGMVLGTVAYMPLEQLDGRSADARSDQFSFCVSLYEALYGERPFAGGSAAELTAALVDGQVRAAPRGSSVPGRLRRALLRGLSQRPDDRWPTMDALLAELRRIVAPRRAWWVAAVLGVGLMATGAGLWQQARARGEDPAASCEARSAALDGVWGDERREAIRERLAVGAGPDPRRRADETVQRLDDYARSWVEESVDACRAARVEGRQSSELLDLRDYCLQYRLDGLRATTDLILGSESGYAGSWHDAVVGLVRHRPVARCRDVTSVYEVGQPPEDPRTREDVAEVRMALARVHVRITAGDFVTAEQLARPALAAAEATGHDPIIAEAKITLANALGLLGRVQEAEELALAGAFLADAAGMHRLRLDALANLTFMMGVLQGRTGEANLLARWGLELERELAPDPTLRARLLSGLGMMHANHGEAEAARKLLEEALLVRKEAGLPEDINLGTTLVGLGGAYLGLGRLEQALETYERAHALLVASRGPRHPASLVAHENVGTTQHALERYEDALQTVDSVIELSSDKGRELVTMASLHSTKGAILLELGRHAEAKAELHRAYGILAPERLNPVLLGVVAGNLAIVELDQRRPEEAREWAERGLQLFREQLGPDHLHLGWMLSLQARSTIELGQPREAYEAAKEALRILDGSDDPAAPDFRSDAALAMARALADPQLAGEPSPRSAREWAELARDDAKAGGRSAEPMLARARAWLRAHGR